jgi:hypothetical protein
MTSGSKWKSDTIKIILPFLYHNLLFINVIVNKLLVKVTAIFRDLFIYLDPEIAVKCDVIQKNDFRVQIRLF